MNSPGAPRTARAGRRDPATGPGVAPYLAAFAVGLLNAIQSRMNGGLAAEWGSPVIAAVWSFGTGLIALSVAVAVMPSVRRGLREVIVALRTSRLKWWQLAGGLCGAVFVIAQSATVPVIGVAAFTVGVVAGQATNSLVVDRFGLGPRGVIPVTPQRCAAAIVAVVAVAVAVSGRWSAPEGIPVLPVLTAFGAGLFTAVQQALNGRVTQQSGSAISATWVNFLLGLTVLAAVLGTAVWAGRVDVGPLGGAAPWLYASGVVGVVFIALAAWAVPRIGVLVTALLAVAGQLTSALLLDLLLPTSGTAVTLGLVAGLALAFLAVWLGFRGRVGR